MMYPMLGHFVAPITVSYPQTSSFSGATIPIPFRLQFLNALEMAGIVGDT